MHAQTLRMYERKGLVNPQRTPGGSRRYSEQDVALLRRIQDLTNSGLNLEGVRRVIDLEAEVVHLRKEVEALRAEREELLRHYRREIVPLSQVNGFRTVKPTAD
jgi:MerR family transcriptional regulator, heat shock protein HspR